MKSKTMLVALGALVLAAACRADDEEVQMSEAAKKSPSLVRIKDVEGLPRVLLIGDSVSMGYTLRVRDRLAGVANVHRPPTNCGSSDSGVAHIDAWLGKKRWDVIHFNWGLHDMKWIKSSKGTKDGRRQNVPPERYEKNLRELVAKMKERADVLIFATTTPIPAVQKHEAPRDQGDVVKYNEIARRVMKENGVLIDDLYAAVLPKQAEWQPEGDVHWKSEGSDALADAVAKSVREALATKAACPAKKEGGGIEKAGEK